MEIEEDIGEQVIEGLKELIKEIKEITKERNELREYKRKNEALKDNS